MSRTIFRTAILIVAIAMAATSHADAQSAPQNGLAWRNVGPMRAGRVAAVTGVIGQPGVFYIGLPAAGVWKTTSAGETWYPVFDAVRDVSSIGAIEAAPSAPNTIYVGTGDMITGNAINEGNGVWKSTDAGQTWQHMGLDGTKQIPSIVVDPRDANVVLIAAQGDVHVKNDTRGVYRSTDAGATWTRTLFVQDDIGIQKLARAYDVPDVIFATTVAHYVAPGLPPRRPPPPDTTRTWTKIFKSTDNGVTWTEISGHGLPRLTGRTSIAVAQNTNAQRVYLIGNWGLYRSDDGGATWRQMDASDRRIRNGQGGYNCGVYVDPKNPDVVYTVNTASYKSTDGGNTFTGFKGAPGGDDPQQMWIDPTNGQRMLFGYDQGAIVSLDGGATWSSWYNQSTEQVYHVSTDNSFPYWIYATQQDAGAIGIRSRGNLGAITNLDWKPVPGWEWGTIIADPSDPNTVYSSGIGVTKITYPAETWIDVGPHIDPAFKPRFSVSLPLVWTRWNGRSELLAGFHRVVATSDGGQHWTNLSPDLAMAVDTTKAPNGAIESMSASSAMPGVIWVGTNNARLHVTRNHGAAWSEVLPAGVPFAGLSGNTEIEASHSNAAEAYLVLDYHARGDYGVYVFRTRDYGQTWTRIVNGLPTSQVSGSFARVVREDPQHPGLLFLGTESGAYVSFDDGDHWQSLQLNLPNTSVRDITVHGNDLVIGTYGRGVWVLDDISPLRQWTSSVAAEPAHLFKPGDAVRVRRNVNSDTPLPPEVPHSENAPPGVMLYYNLATAPTSPVTIDVLDASGNVVRHLTSVARPPVAEAAQPPEPNFWLAPPYAIPAAAGLNRATWDMRYDDPPAFTHSFEINANPGETPTSPLGALALPGVYTFRLNVDGKTYTQTASVLPDPRVKVPAEGVAAQHALQMQITRGLQHSYYDYYAADSLRIRIKGIASADSTKEAKIRARIDSLTGTINGGGFFFGPRASATTFTDVNATLVGLLNAQDNGDFRPTAAMHAAVDAACKDLTAIEARWRGLVASDLAEFNKGLTTAVTAPVFTPGRGGCM